MGIGTCDPASRGDAFNFIAQEIGPVLLEARYGWDGVSVRPDCVGPLDQVRVRNRSDNETWYVWMEGKRGTWRSFELTPLFDQTIKGGPLGARGLDTNEDLSGLTFSRSPNPPA